MPSKEYLVDDLKIKVYKRRTNRNLRLSVTSTGDVRVSIPVWAPYAAGVKFASSRIDWIKQQIKPAGLLDNRHAIGKSHHLYFTLKPRITKPSSRISGTDIIVSYPEGLSIEDALVQEVATKACLRALKQQAEALLPQRLKQLADKNELSFAELKFKRLKGRWGSCDQHSNIVLNIFLMQLPWDLIDYVLLHELAHTVVLKHGPDFWVQVDKMLPEAKSYRKRLKEFQPVLNSIA